MNGKTAGDGGAVYFDSWGTVINCNFKDNYAGRDGGAVAYADEIINCTFINNYADWYGGAIRHGSAENCTFKDNYASCGGAIYYKSNYRDTVVNCTFSGNSAEKRGGAIHVDDNGQCAVKNCSFFVNSAGYYGGAFYGDSSSAVNCIFKFNEAKYYGGATDWVDAVNCIFQFNHVDQFGGAMTSGDAVNCIFADNDADYGGAIYSGDAVNCTFIGNSADKSGGAIRHGSAVNCTFILNSAEIDGGAMYDDGSAVNCTFTSNYAAENGGAIYDGDAESCIFENNHADGYGGAVSAYGDGYYSSVESCIFMNNTAGVDGDNTYNTNVLKPILSVSNFISSYKSGERLIINFTNSKGIPINNANVTIRVYKNSALVGTYYCLSGDGWVVNLDKGNYNAVVSVDSGYGIDSVSATLEIKLKSKITSQNATVTFKDGSELVATLTNADTGKAISGVNLVFNINDVKYTVKTDSKGQAKLSTNGLTPGNYTVTISYAGNVNYNSSSATANVVVNKADTVISAPKASVAFKDPSGKLVATLTNAYGNGLGVNLNVNLNGQSYTIKANSKGQITIPTEDLPVGTHTATISYGGNVNYNPSTATAKIVVNKANTEILASNVSVAYKDTTEQLIATLTNAYGNTISGNIIVNINGKDYAVTAYSNGKIRVSTATLSPGSYVATISFKGSSNYKASSATANVVVTKADAVISAPDVTVAYKDTTGELVATIANAYGKPLNVNLNVNFNGKDYTLKADSNGQITLPIGVLTPGTYVATISYKGNVNYNPTSTSANVIVTKADAVISAPDVSVAYKDSTGELVATITNAYGKPLSVNVNVNINGMDYAVKADSQGKISISTLGLAPGSYKATITYNGNVNYNSASTTANIIVNKADTVITAQDVTVKAGDENGKLVATLKNEYGNGLGVKVNVNLNGQDYTIKAGSNGKIIIPTADLGSGNYTATISYAGNVNYNPTTTTAKIVVKP